MDQSATPTFDYITRYYHDKQQNFIVRVQEEMDNEHFYRMVANVLSLLPHEVDLRDQRGERWMCPTSLRVANVATLYVRREGMQQDDQRSRSPTHARGWRTVSNTWAFRPHSDSGSTDSSQTVRELREQRQREQQQCPDSKRPTY